MNKFIGLLLCSILSTGLWSQMPTQQVSNFAITDTFAWKVAISFKVPTTSDSAILIMSKSPLSSLNLTNRFYGVGFNITSGVKVLKKFYKGTNTIFHTIYGLEANTTYYLAFYTFNNNTNGIFYNQTNPLKVDFKTKGKNRGTYYNTLDTNKAVFLSKLGLLLRNHAFNSTWYTDFRNVVSEVYERDTFLNDSSKKYVLCDYSGIVAVYLPPFSFAATNFNREHTLPKNWMNFRGIPNNNLVDYMEGADWHNLTLTDGNVNSQRSDFVYKIPKTPSFMGAAKYYENKSNYNDTNNCFEPQNSYKGNAARCVFYMQLCYHKLLDSNWGFKNGLHSFAKYQQQELLKSWARTDTVDNFEIARHEYIASVQGSRNPFIDFPDWIDCIDFNDLRLLKTCEGLTIPSKPNSIDERTENWDVWYYQYSPNQYIIKYYMDKISINQLQIVDLSGKIVYSETQRANEGENSFWLSPENLRKGVYIIQLSNPERIKNIKLLVE